MRRNDRIRGKYRGWAVAKQYMTSAALKTSEFRLEWFEWVAHRAETGKPLTHRMIKGQIKTCEEWGHDRAVRAVRHSWSQGYQGLFEPGGAATPPSPGRVTVAKDKYDHVRDN